MTLTTSTGITATDANIATAQHALMVLDAVLQDEIRKLASEGRVSECDDRHGWQREVGIVRDLLDGWRG